MSPFDLASLDGTLLPVAEATVPVTDEGLLRGDGAFEVMRLYSGRPFAYEDHLARLNRTCAGLHGGDGIIELRAYSGRPNPTSVWSAQFDTSVVRPEL